MPSTVVARSALEDGVELAVVMAESGITNSRSEARRLIRGGGVYLNGERVADMGVAVEQSDPIEDRFVLVRIGKKRQLVVEVG